MSLEDLIQQAIDTKQGSKEFCLYHWEDGSWSAHIGNRSQWVALLEIEAELSAKGDTPIEAVERLVRVIRDAS